MNRTEQNRNKISVLFCSYPHNLIRSFDDCIHKVSYISAYVLLSLLKKLVNSDKMLGLSSILSLFHKFNYTRAQMFESIYYMTFKITKNSHFWRENVKR